MISTQVTYLDHNATTPLRPAVIEVMQQIAAFPLNPSSIHKAGREARRLVEDSRQALLKAVNAGPRDVLVFTSGATEANNTVLRGVDVERLIVSAIEHPSVLNATPEKDILPVLPSGVIDVAALDKMLEGNTRQTLVSVMLVNNETGVIQPIEDVAAIVRRRGALLHCDAVQAFGKIPLDMQKLGVDFLTLSAHKMGGPQGMGCLVLSNCLSLEPLLKGGNQEKNLRAGTENLSAIMGFAKATELIDLDAYQKLSVLRDKIESQLSAVAGGLKIFGKDTPRISNTTMFCLPGASSETQLIALDLAGICVSNGSACSSGTVKASHVLKAMGVTDAEAESSLRISLGWNTREQDVDFFIAEWLKMYERIKGRLTHA
jgi:cysteine desulfurase